MLVGLVFLVLLAAAPSEAALTEEQIAKLVLERIELIQIELILNNPRILSKYIGCILRTGVCTPEARDFRKMLPSMIRKPCVSCNDSQKRALKRILSHVRDKRPEDWQKMKVMYDPQEKYVKVMDDFLAV